MAEYKELFHTNLFNMHYEFISNVTEEFIESYNNFKKRMLMIRCLDLLSLDSFKGFKLVAGKGGLGKTVTWPYMKYTEKIGQWVKGGELVIVSGYDGFTDEVSLLNLMQE